MISIIIPAYKNADEVGLLLQSIGQRCTGVFEVIVVDDGSPNQQLSEVCAKYPFAKCLRLSQNQGAAHARNVGARSAQYDLLLYLDSDMLVRSDLVKITIERFADKSIAAAVGSVEPVPVNPGYFRNFWALVKAFSLPEDAYSSTFYPMVGAIRREVFDDIGGFDEKFRGASVEDYEFSARLDARGWRVRYIPELAVQTHYKDIRTSLRQSFARSMKWVLLFRERRRFDNHTTTPWQAIGTLCGAALLVLVPLIFLDQRIAILAAACAVAYFAVNGSFLRYVAKVAGVGFVPLAVVFHLLLSATVTLGAARGLLQLPLGEERRRALLYR